MVTVDYFLDRFKSDKKSLALYYINLEKAFDTIPKYCLMIIPMTYYSLNKDYSENLQTYVYGCSWYMVGHDNIFKMIIIVK